MACLVCSLDMEELEMTLEEFQKSKRLCSMEDQIANENVGM